MLLARSFLIFTGLVFAVYGAFCIISPQFVADTTGMHASDVAITEIRAMYGGLELALGIFLLYCLRNEKEVETGILLMIFCFAGLATTRAIGLFETGGDSYNNSAFAYEFISFMMSIFALVRLRAQLDQHKKNTGFGSQNHALS